MADGTAGTADTIKGARASFQKARKVVAMHMLDRSRFFWQWKREKNGQGILYTYFLKILMRGKWKRRREGAKEASLQMLTCSPVSIMSITDFRLVMVRRTDLGWERSEEKKRTTSGELISTRYVAVQLFVCASDLLQLIFKIMHPTNHKRQTIHDVQPKAYFIAFKISLSSFQQNSKLKIHSKHHPSRPSHTTPCSKLPDPKKNCAHAADATLFPACTDLLLHRQLVS